jgi:hypothetical protein
MPIIVAVRSGIVASSTAQDIDVCPRLSVLCYPMKVEALRQAKPSLEIPNKCRTGLQFQ